MLSIDNGKQKHIVNTHKDIKKFMEAVIKRTIAFLIEEVHIKISKANYELNEVNTLIFQNLTSIITIEDCARMTIVFSYEDLLIKEIFQRYTSHIEIDEQEVKFFMEETSGDMINIIIGNVLSDFEQPGIVFAMSTPIIINEAKNIIKYKNQKTYCAEITTEYGDMLVYCIMQGDLFFNQLCKARE